MPIPGSRANQAAIRRILVATGLGAVFGIQSWFLVKYGFGASVPWYGLAGILLAQTLLGFSAGATAGATRWWKRGLLFGLVFSIPPAFGAHAPGLRWAPYGAAVITAGLAAGLLIAFISDALYPPTRTSTAQPSPVRERPSGADNRRATAIRQRMAEEKAWLEHLDTERERRGDSGFGKTTEDRIVWGELLELELQDIDEQVNRIRGAAGRRPGKSMETNLHLREGGSHERNDP